MIYFFTVAYCSEKQPALIIFFFQTQPIGFFYQMTRKISDT